MPVTYQDSGMDAKTLGAYRASGQSDIGKFLADQGGAKDATPPGVPAMAGGLANFQGVTNAEKTPTPFSVKAANTALASGGGIAAARQVGLRTAQAEQPSFMDRLNNQFGTFITNILGGTAAPITSPTPAPTTVMEAKAYGADPSKIVVAPLGKESDIATRWSPQ
jgi:hypothetical protein